MATWKKIVVSGSAISQLNNDAGYLIADSNSVSLTGSFTGSFVGDGSNLTGVVASNANPLTDGAGIIDFSYDGSSSGVTVSVDSGSLAGNGITTSGGAFVVQASDSTITVGAGGISVSEANLSGIPNSALSNNSITFGSTAVALGDTVSQLNITGYTGSFTGSFTGVTNLPDLTDGNGIADFTYDGSSAATIAVEADGSTLSVGSGGVKVADAGITATQIATSVAGAGLAGGAGTALSVGVDDSSIEITGDTLNVKAGGVSNAMLASGGQFTLGSTAVTLGGTTGTVAGLTSLTSTALVATNITNSGTVANTKITGSFTGSFVGDGSGLTGVASTLAISGSSGNGTVALKTQALSIAAGEGIDTVASNQTITISGEDATATNKGIASFASADFAVSSGAVSLQSDITIDQDLTVTRDATIGRNALIQGNLVVQGTASFQHAENLDVADRFIRLASGSSTNGDGGIVVQQNADGTGEVFGFDNPTKRFGVSGSFDSTDNSFTPDAFMAAVVEGAANDPTAVIAKYTKKGNIFIANNEDIYIYS